MIDIILAIDSIIR